MPKKKQLQLSFFSYSINCAYVRVNDNNENWKYYEDQILLYNVISFFSRGSLIWYLEQDSLYLSQSKKMYLTVIRQLQISQVLELDLKIRCACVNVM